MVWGFRVPAWHYVVVSGPLHGMVWGLRVCHENSQLTEVSMGQLRIFVTDPRSPHLPAPRLAHILHWCLMLVFHQHKCAEQNGAFPTGAGVRQDQAQQLCGCEAGRGDESVSAGTDTNCFTGLSRFCNTFYSKTPVPRVAVTSPG